MTTVRDFVDSSGAQSSIASAKRDDELTRALAAAWRTIDALVEFITSEDLSHDRLVAIGRAFHDTEQRDRVFAAEANLDRGDPGEWLARERQRARSQPAIAPRGTTTARPSVGGVVAVDVDPRTGQQRKWRQSPVTSEGGP
jgi:hypothetical protein